MAESPDEDQALVQSALGGDEDAFRALFDKYKDRALAVAFRYTHDHESALDVVQDAFIKAFRKLGDFRGQSRFVHWLFRIVANAAIDFGRRKPPPTAPYDEGRESGSPPAPDDRPDADPVRRAEGKELQEAYSDALNQLSPEHKAAFALHATQGLAYREIAEVLDVPIGTVMSRLHYARKHLQEKSRTKDETMMNCSDIKPLLSAYFDGELPDEQRELVDAHLPDCADCSAELEGFSRIEAISNIFTAPRASEQEWDKVWGNVRAALPATRRRRWLRPVGAFAAAAVLLIALGAGYILYGTDDALAEPTWVVESLESSSPNVTVGYYYDPNADVTIIQAIYVPEENGADTNGEST
jgi:RNA polymerase sigma-70 factor (ECF subfamily)